MRKVICIALALAMMLTMSACGWNSPAPTHTTETPTVSSTPTPTTQPKRTPVRKLTHTDIMNWMNGLFQEYYGGQVTDFKKKVSDKPGEIDYGFSYVRDNMRLFSAAYTEVNGVIRNILVTSLPSNLQFDDSFSASELAVAALMFARGPMLPCGGFADVYSGQVWHSEMMSEHLEEEDNTVMASYKDGNWSYFSSVSEHLVLCTAVNLDLSDSGSNDTNPGTTQTTKPSTGSNQSNQDPCASGHTYKNGYCMYCGVTDPNYTCFDGHSYAAATCEKPKTCSACGATTGSKLNHDWQITSCTAPKACTMCGKKYGVASGHSWKEANCVEPKTCTVCHETDGEPYGHWMNCTVCYRYGCDYVDFSCIAGTYSDVNAYDSKGDLVVTDLKVSIDGVLSFTFNDKNYAFDLIQNDKGDAWMDYFDCYINGELDQNVEFRAGSEIYKNRIYFSWINSEEGFSLYFSALPDR